MPIFLFLLVWPFTFTDISDYVITFTPRINLAPFLISITTDLVELLQMILGCGISFGVCQSLCLSICIRKIYCFHIIMVLCHLPLFYSNSFYSNYFCHTFTKEAGNLKVSSIIHIHLKFLELVKGRKGWRGWRGGEGGGGGGLG